MSAIGTREITWANGTDTFCIAKIGLLLDLEDKCKAGLAAIFARIGRDEWYVNDIRETIRLGLIGGGMAPKQAMEAVQRHVDGAPLAPSVLIAHHVLAAALIGVPDDPVGKGEPAVAVAAGSTTTTAASAAPNSTD